MPSHYQSNGKAGIPCMDAIRSALTQEEWVGFLKGNVIKYTWRERNKGRLEDAEKLEDYAHRLRFAISERDAE